MRILRSFRHTPHRPVRPTHQARRRHCSKLQSGDGASVAIGQLIRITSGTGANTIRMIVATSGYGTDVVAVNRDWTVPSGSLPDNTSIYSVFDGMLFEISPNAVVAVTRCFSTAAADVPGGSTRTFYEKVFVVSNNTATALTSATIQVASDTPSLPGPAALDIALCTALNDEISRPIARRRRYLAQAHSWYSPLRSTCRRPGTCHQDLRPLPPGHREYGFASLCRPARRPIRGRPICARRAAQHDGDSSAHE